MLTFDKIRNCIPLRVRILVGPIFAYTYYVYIIYIKNNNQRPIVLSITETIDNIKSNNFSAIRFGDGEMSLIYNENLGFQKSDILLGYKLKQILQTNKPDLLICIPGIWDSINHFSKRSFWFTLHHLFKYRNRWLKLINRNQIYGDAFITRPYLNFKDKTKSGEIFKNIVSLWDNQNVLLIEGEKSRLGVGNNLFENSKSLKRILGPSENAFSKCQQIIEEASKVSTDKLILLSLGPAAKVVSYELYLKGYRVIDIGHLDMEYEMFLRNSENIVKVPYKYFNEIGERNPDECTDRDYIDQIIAVIK